MIGQTCYSQESVLDSNGKCNYTPSCILGTFKNGMCVDIPENNKCKFHTFNPSTGKCDLPPKKDPKSSGCINDSGYIFGDTNALPLLLQQKNSDFKLYTYEGENCIINPIAYTPYCHVYRDGKMDQVNPTTNTCQWDATCIDRYEPTFIPTINIK